MRRPIASFLVTALLCAPVFACDKPGVTEKQKEMKATEQAEQASQQATKDIAAARSDFEKTREDYLHARRIDVLDLNRRVAEIDEKASTAKGKEKTDLDARLAVIRPQRDAFVRHVEALYSTAPSSWDGDKANLDKEWDALNKAVYSVP